MPDPTHSSAGGSDGEGSPGPSADFQLVRAFLARDGEATARLATRLQVIPRMLAGLCRRFGFPLTPDELADVAQDAVAIALRRLGQLGPHVPLEAWLHCLCSYELSNAVRRKRRNRMAGLAADVPSAVDDALVRLERQELVLLALEQLDPDEATAVRLHHLEGRTFLEISAQLGVTQNIVKGRYYRAIAKLSLVMSRHAPTRNTP